jgi:hypothetical protein
MHDGHDVRGFRAQRAGHGRRIGGAAPFSIQSRDVGAVPRQNLRQPVREVTVDDDQRPFSGFGQIGDHGFHA